jgi:LacI family transcriptional regulator
MAGNKVVRRSVTLREVAAAARVHVATASRALDSQTAHPVSPETRARVKRVAEELGYQHHMMARGLRRGFSSTVGVVVADLGNPYTPPVLRGLQSRLESDHYMALMTESLDDSQVLERAVGHLLARQVDGLVLLAVRSGDLDRVLGWASRVPVVLAVRSLPGSGVPAVTHDDLGGARLAAAHLAELGHRRVVQLPGPPDIQPFKDRNEAFAEAAAELGLEAWAVKPSGRPVFDEGRRLMRVALAGGDSHRRVRPNDAMAMGAVRALRDAGLHCPGDVSVVGYNDVPMADCLDPPLTTIRLNGDQVGRRAAEAVLGPSAGCPPLTAARPSPAELVARPARPAAGPAPGGHRMRRSRRSCRVVRPGHVAAPVGSRPRCLRPARATSRPAAVQAQAMARVVWTPARSTRDPATARPAAPVTLMAVVIQVPDSVRVPGAPVRRQHVGRALQRGQHQPDQGHHGPQGQQ